MARIVIGHANPRRERVVIASTPTFAPHVSSSSSEHRRSVEAGAVPFVLPLALAAGKALAKGKRKRGDKPRVPLGVRLENLRDDVTSLFRRRETEDENVIDVPFTEKKAETAAGVGALLTDTDGYRRRV